MEILVTLAIIETECIANRQTLFFIYIDKTSITIQEGTGTTKKAIGTGTTQKESTGTEPGPGPKNKVPHMSTPDN